MDEPTQSSEHNMSIWIILVALLLVSGLVAHGALALLHANQQGETATGSQTAPGR